MYKKCSDCRVDKDTSEFHKNKTKADGLQTHCIECQKTKAKKHYIANKAAYVERAKANKHKYDYKFVEFKRDVSCVKCGEDDVACIDFHHLDPQKKEFNVSIAIRQKLSIERIKEEIAKCVTLCANCHRKLHAGRFSL